MKFAAIVLFLAATVVAQTAAPVHQTASKTKTAVKKAPAKGSSPAKGGSAKSGSAKGRKRVAAAPPRQAAPTPDRYKEIQTALAAKGYLKSEPSGVWDAQSMDAMKRYQADQNQEATGKLTAASLIGLGLGPKTASMTTSNLHPAEVPEPPAITSTPTPQP